MSGKTRRSLNSVDLVVCMGNIKDFKFLKIFMNFVDFWPLCNINLESDCSEKLGNQEKVCKRNFVSNAVGTFAAFKKLFEGIEPSDHDPLDPWDFFIISKSWSDFRNNTHVLDWLYACVNLLTESSDLPSFYRVVREKSGQMWVHLFKVLADG